MTRWLEILPEFNYTIEHRAGVRHINADRLSRRPCQDCQQCHHIQERDGEPGITEVLASLNPGPVIWENGYLRQEPDSHATQGFGVAGVQPDPRPNCVAESEAWVQPLHKRENLTPVVLAVHQATEPGAVGIMYAVIRDYQDIADEVLQNEGWELKKVTCTPQSHPNELCLNLDTSGSRPGRARNVAISPPGLRRTTMM